MSTNMRIGGLASGMDIDSIMEDLMKAYRMPVQKLEQDKQILEWQQEGYREINTKLLSFRDTAFDMRLQSTYLAKKASSSNESILTATAGTNATPGNYDITVDKLAEGVSIGSKNNLADVDSNEDETKSDGTTAKLYEQFSGISDGDTITFTLAGSKGDPTPFSFDASTSTIYDVVSKINNAELGIKASYDTEYNRFFLASESTGSDQIIKVTNDTMNFMSYDTATETIDDTILKLEIKQGSDIYKGKDAQFDFSGANDINSSTNSVTINGVSMELKSLGTNTVTVTSNTDAVFDSVVKFIDEYNKVIEPITDKLHETKYRDYKPLTDAQREQLTDDQIDQWIEKAQSGLLRNDPILSNVQSKMRMTMSTSVPTGNSDYDRMADIGIATTKDYMSGKLVVDEAKLRQAIESDPEAVMELFAHAPDSEDYSDMGIARRLYEDVNNAMKRISDKAGSKNDYSLVDDSFIGKRIDRIEDQIDRKEERLTQVEDRYWRQFTAMEKAIQQMNQQSAWLSQQFGSS